MNIALQWDIRGTTDFGRCNLVLIADEAIPMHSIELLQRRCGPLALTCNESRTEVVLEYKPNARTDLKQTAVEQHLYLLGLVKWDLLKLRVLFSGCTDQEIEELWTGWYNDESAWSLREMQRFLDKQRDQRAMSYTSLEDWRYCDHESYNVVAMQVNDRWADLYLTKKEH